MTKIPTISLANGGNGTHYLQTLNNQYVLYNYREREFNYKAIEENLPSVQAFRDFLAEIHSLEDRKAIIMDKFREWNEHYPEIEFAAWLIEQYKTVDINWQRDQWRLKQASNGDCSWEEVLNKKEEEIAELKSALQEKDAIIKLKTQEHDEYVRLHGTDDGEGKNWLMKIDGKDIYLALKEYTIILYTLIRLATNQEKLSANQKRLIGRFNTVDSYINDLKTIGRTPLNETEKEHIKTVLNAENIPYQDILKEYL